MRLRTRAALAVAAVAMAVTGTLALVGPADATLPDTDQVYARTDNGYGRGTISGSITWTSPRNAAGTIRVYDHNLSDAPNCTALYSRIETVDGWTGWTWHGSVCGYPGSSAIPVSRSSSRTILHWQFRVTETNRNVAAGYDANRPGWG